MQDLARLDEVGIRTDLDPIRHVPPGPRDRDVIVGSWSADASGESIDTLVPPSRLALVVGNEGGGLSSLSRTRSDRLVALPIAASTDSLNVAVAAGILLYELRARQP